MKLPNEIEALTFDCYGTIVDWDGGIRAAMEAISSLEGCDFDRLVREREEDEATLLAGGFRLYGEILGESLVLAAERQERKPTDDEIRTFVASMGTWPLFPDSTEALVKLAQRFRLAVLSNVETAVLRQSLASLEAAGALFDPLVTAQEVQSYKPAPRHFDVGQESLALPRKSILHVAGSLYHDIRPARALGWTTVWIDRRGEGLPDDPALEDQLVFPDLASLCSALFAASDERNLTAPR